MKIGIDIDGVLNSQYNFCIDYGTKFCNEIGKYDEECKKIENDYIISLETVFNRLCINAKKGKINEKGTLKTYIEKIEQMNYQLEQFIKKVVYSF